MIVRMFNCLYRRNWSKRKNQNERTQKKYLGRETNQSGIYRRFNAIVSQL